MNFKNSIIIKMFFKFFIYFGNLFEESYILKKINYNKEKSKEIKTVNNNFIFIIVNKFLNLTAKYINSIKNESLFIRFLKNIFSVRIENVFFSLFIITLGLIHSIVLINFINNTGDVISLMIMTMADVLLLIQIIFKNIKGSKIIDLLNNVSDNFKIYNNTVFCLKNIFLILIGIFLAIIFNKIGIFLFIKFFLGIITTYIIFRYYEIGIYIFVISIPFLSDQSTVAILLITVISGMLKWILFEEFKFNNNKYNKVFIILILIFIINTILSVNFYGSIRDLVINVLSIGLILTMINNVKNEKVINRVFDFIIGASFIVAIYGFYQYIIGIPMESGWVDPKSNISIRVFSTFENPNLFAEYLVLVIPITIAKLVNSDLKYKIIYFIALIAQLVVLALTFSRGGWLGLIVSLGLFVLLIRKDLIVKLIPIGLISIFFIPNSIVMRMKSIGDLSDSSNYYRFQIWEKSINIIKDFFVTGVGLGFESFRTISNLYIKDFTPFHAHNTYLELAIEIGVVGLFIFLLLIIISLFDVKNQMYNSNKVYTVALISAVVGLFIHGIAEHVLYNPKVIFQFWMILGLLITMNVKFMKVRD
jgi:O-antigen ligase